MQSRSRIFRMALLTALAAFPALVLAHTGADGGAHHNFLDELAHGVSDIDYSAALLAAAVWGVLFGLHQWIRRSAVARDRRRAARLDRKP